MVLGRERELVDLRGMYYDEAGMLRERPPRDWAGVRLLANKFATSRSHLGGHAELDDASDWPVVDGEPLQFLAAIHLSDLAARPGLPGYMPRHGVLNFFERHLNCRVIRSMTPRLIEPPPGVEAFRRVAVEFSSEPAALTKPTDEPTPINRIGGEPDWIQRGAAVGDLTDFDIDLSYRLGRCWSDPVVLAEFERAGVKPADFYSDPRPFDTTRLDAAKQLDKASVSPSILGRTRERWFLLLQLDSDESLGFEFGDAGRLYFFIPEQALAEENFNEIIGDMDCY
jgi:hypothetical protein